MTETGIANLALGNLGISRQIGNLGTERSLEANVMRQWFEICRDNVLGDFKWQFAAAFVAPGLVAQNPTTEWAYAYRYPPNCLVVRRILSGLRTDVRASRVPFRIVADSAGQLIYTDMQNAMIEYTFQQTDPSKFSADFNKAFSLNLGAYAAPQLTGGDPNNRQAKCMQLYKMEIVNAQVNAANEEQPDIEPDSEFILARGGGQDCWPNGTPWRP